MQNKVTYVGLIVEIATPGNNLQLKIDDGTAPPVEINSWDVNEDQENQTNMENIRPFTYVRVHGSLRSFQGKRSIFSFRVLPIQDPNEITYHALEAIYVQCYNTKGPLVSFNNTQVKFLFFKKTKKIEMY